MSTSELKRKMIIHIGRHKTGTTSLQKQLYNDSEILDKNGYVYPRYFMRGSAHHLVSEQLSSSEFINKTEDQKKECIFEFRNTIYNESPENKTVILSSEAFQNCNPKYVAELLNDFEVQVVFYVREQSAYIASAYLQEVHAKENAINYTKFVNNFYADYFDFTSKWRRYFPDIKCGIFEKKHLLFGDLVIDFYEKYLGIKLSKERVIKDSNPSLTRRYMAFKEIYNNKLSEGDLGYLIQKDKLYACLAHLSVTDDSGKFLVSESTASFISKKFSASNEMFFKTFLPNYRFGNPKYSDVDSYQMSHEEFLDLHRQISDMSWPIEKSS